MEVLIPIIWIGDIPDIFPRTRDHGDRATSGDALPHVCELALGQGLHGKELISCIIGGTLGY